MSQIWDRIRKISGKYSQHHSPCITVGDNVTSDPGHVAEIVSQHFESVSSNQQYSADFLRMKIVAEQEHLDLSTDEELPHNSPITPRDIGSDGGMLATAAGDDKIVCAMLKHIHNSALDFLLHIYNQIWLGLDVPLSGNKQL